MFIATTNAAYKGSKVQRFHVFDLNIKGYIMIQTMHVIRIDNKNRALKESQVVTGQKI